MMVVETETYLRVGDDCFVPCSEVEVFTGDCHYVSGAIVLTIGGEEVLSLELWDDVNWLWPFVVQALDECRRVGDGERFFPSQPLLFAAKRLGSSGQLLVSVTGGGVDRTAVAMEDHLFRSVGRAGLDFYASLRRLCPGEGPADGEIIAVLESWVGDSSG